MTTLRSVRADMRRLYKWLLLPVLMLVAMISWEVWVSGPTVPLQLTREQAIERAATIVTIHGEILWSQVDTKLVRYSEWNGLAGFTSGAPDMTDESALVWVVAYDGPTPSADFCQWGVIAFAADDRMSRDWRGSECGVGHRPIGFDRLLDRSWFRLDMFRGG